MKKLVASMSVTRWRILPPTSASIGNSAPTDAMTPAKGCSAAAPMMGGTPHAIANRKPRSQCNRASRSPVSAAAAMFCVPGSFICLNFPLALMLRLRG